MLANLEGHPPAPQAPLRPTDTLPPGNLRKPLKRPASMKTKTKTKSKSKTKMNTKREAGAAADPHASSPVELDDVQLGLEPVETQEARELPSLSVEELPANLAAASPGGFADQTGSPGRHRETREAGEITLASLLGEVRGLAAMVEALGSGQEDLLARQAALERRLDSLGPHGLNTGDLLDNDDDEVDDVSEFLGPLAVEVPHQVRAGRRRAVLVIDDDSESRQAAVAALQEADFPAQARASGNDGLAAVAECQPDLIVVEPGISGELGGRELIDTIKATGEWADIPVVLYTRMPVTGQREVHTVYGADDCVLKGPEGPASLVDRVVSLMRRR